MWFTITSIYRKCIASHPSVGMAFTKTPSTPEPKQRLYGDRSVSYGAQPQKYTGIRCCPRFLWLL